MKYEKSRLTAGKDNWHLATEPEVTVSDGPHGLRIEQESRPGFNRSSEAVAWPVLAALGSSFDRELVYTVGSALAEECISENVQVLLAPGVNHKRSPLCGRNFEYFSEDPVLSGELGSAYVGGLQDLGVGSSLKHYAGNSREKGRLVTDSIIDERALHEIYLKQFDTVIRKVKPWTIMTAYNMLNGIYCSENERLMDHARKQGFDGVFVSDWGAVSNPVSSVKHGLNLVMPGSHGIPEVIDRAVEKGIISEEKLNESGSYVEKLAERVSGNTEKPFDLQMHLDLALRAAEESAVLLKNDGVLPLSRNMTFALIGELLQETRHGGTGSSRVQPVMVDHVADVFEKRNLSCVCDEGKDIGKVIEICKDRDVVIVGAGYTDASESEGYDRKNMQLPPEQNELIHALAKAHNHVVVVLQAGSPVIMPWLDDVSAVLHVGLPGCRGGSAVTNLLFGIAVPSGRLSETFPLTDESVPCYLYFDDHDHQMQYRESIFTGYRYYDTFDVPVCFPFGYGLSYTTFAYRNIRIDGNEVEFRVRNTGGRDAREIMSLYVGMKDSRIARAKKELKDFVSLYLKKGEEKIVRLPLRDDMFTYYDTKRKDWCIEKGTYQIMICGAVNEVHLCAEIEKDGIEDPYSSVRKEYLKLEDGVVHVSDEDFEKVLERRIPQFKKNIDADSSLRDLQKTLPGRVINRILEEIVNRTDLLPGVDVSTILDSPLRMVLMASPGVSWDTVDGIVEMARGRKLRGIRKTVRSLRKKK